jgi:hypothetical protein
MGLPTTWFLLSLVHLFWVEEATLASPEFRKSAAVCGDDLEAFWPDLVIDRYHMVLNQCGGKISVGKHFVLSRAGCFTEKLFSVKELLPVQASNTKRGGSGCRD